jgi:hypothetical protein
MSVKSIPNATVSTIRDSHAPYNTHPALPARQLSQVERLTFERVALKATKLSITDPTERLIGP